jgi:hypothetical protein
MQVSSGIWIPENYLAAAHTGLPSNMLSIRVLADDSGCSISNTLSMKTDGSEETTSTYTIIWRTQKLRSWCRSEPSQYSIGQAAVTNFSLISCIPSHLAAAGTLALLSHVHSTRNFLCAPSVQHFAVLVGRVTFPRDISRGAGNLELESNECEVLIYTLLSKHVSASPLLPEVILNSTETLFTYIFLAYAFHQRRYGVEGLRPRG